MDPISIVIIVTVLSLSSALIYLFKSDFERRKKAYLASGTNGNQNSQQINHITGTGTARKQQAKNAKQVQSQGAKQNGNSILQAGGKNAASKPQVPSQAPPEFREAKANQKQQFSARNAPGSTANQDTEPSLDELDASVQLGVFNPKFNGQLLQETPAMSKKALRKLRQTAEAKEPASYSSEQLFRIIAAANLSREEIELAVETLLNKIELGQPESSCSDWKQPKNDPMQRLKTQLRDSELALASESQNHEQTRTRLAELKAELQLERSSSNQFKDELAKLRKEFNVLSLALEQARSDQSKQQMIQNQAIEDRGQLLSELEQSNGQLQSLMASLALKEAESMKYRKELEEKLNQLRGYELSTQTLAETIRELENKLRSIEHQRDQLRSSKQHDEYEACAKISDLEADKATLEKVLKDRLSRLGELSDTNNMLEKSVKELQVINGRQEDMLTRLRDERHLNEASMKRTLCEMDRELKELQSKLSLSSNGSAVNRNDRSPSSNAQSEQDYQILVEKASEREQKLAFELNQLRDGLSALLPKGSIRASDIKVAADDWVQQYLGAVRQLSLTVEELRASKSNSPGETSPVKMVANGSLSSSRVGSPNGRSSRGASGSPSDERKKVMETKLLELNEYANFLEEDIKRLEEEKRSILSSSSQSSVLTTDSDEGQQSQRNNLLSQQQYEQKIKELMTSRNKLEAQIKYGLDSLRLEQEKVRSLETELEVLRELA